MDDDGFYMAELRGQRGLVPSNFLTDAPNQGKSLLGGMLGGLTGNTGGLTGPPPPPRGGMMAGKKGKSEKLYKITQSFALINLFG